MSDTGPTDRRDRLADARTGPLASLFTDGPVWDVGAGPAEVSDGSQAAVFAGWRLQDLADYRGAIRRWFRAVRPGGHLVIAVPHAFLHDRRLALPSPRQPHARRLYTPASLLAELEEALAPNSYRVRHAFDEDTGVDYAASHDGADDGRGECLLAIEKITPPEWPLDALRDTIAATPDWQFEPKRTRIETAAPRACRKILVLKLDHMGDFLMAMPALERLRTLFAGSEITLAVGAWNVEMATTLGVADRLITFDAFPRNSTEEQADVRGRVSAFRDLVTDEYDLAVDLRTDVDTRVLLQHVRAGLKAGVGTAAQFPFLDVFLPLDFNRNRPETAREYHFGANRFPAQGSAERSDYRIVSRADRVERDCAILWGPYERLRPGRYFFEPHIELEGAGSGRLLLDIGLDTKGVASHLLPDDGARPVRIPFTVERADREFEFRVFTLGDEPTVDFSFFGGRLVREGAGSTLHQSEYSQLLVELIAIRLERTGLLAEQSAPETDAGAAIR